MACKVYKIKKRRKAKELNALCAIYQIATYQLPEAKITENNTGYAEYT